MVLIKQKNANKMEQLTFDELLDYYLGFGIGGKEKIWNNLTDINLSKSLAFKEITRRVEIYRNKNLVAVKVQKLLNLSAKYMNLLESTGLEYSCLFIDTECGDIKSFIKYLSFFSFRNCNSELIQISGELRANVNELNHIWDNDPEKLRYDSKFRGLYSQQYYSAKVLKDLIFTENFNFNYSNSAVFGEGYLDSIVRDTRKYDIVFFPIFNSSELNLGLLNSFIIEYNVIKFKKSVLWFLIVDEKQSFKNEPFILKHINSFETKLINKNWFYFDQMKYTKIIKQDDGTWFFGNLLNEIDEFIDCIVNP